MLMFLGRVGGLGYNSFAIKAKLKDPTLPNNALYSHFVRSGTYHKRTFVDIEDDQEQQEVEKKRNRKDKKKKKHKKLKKDKIKSEELVDSVKIKNQSYTDTSLDVNAPSNQFSSKAECDELTKDLEKSLKKIKEKVLGVIEDFDDKEIAKNTTSSSSNDQTDVKKLKKKKFKSIDNDDQIEHFQSTIETDSLVEVKVKKQKNKKTDPISPLDDREQISDIDSKKDNKKKNRKSNNEFVDIQHDANDTIPIKLKKKSK